MSDLSTSTITIIQASVQPSGDSPQINLLWETSLAEQVQSSLTFNFNNAESVVLFFRRVKSLGIPQDFLEKLFDLDTITMLGAIASNLIAKSIITNE